MSDKFSFELVTPEGVAFEAEVYQATLPTPDGDITVLPHHQPLITLVSAGVIALTPHTSDTINQIDYYATNGGVAEIDGRRVRLLADAAERADDIDEMKAKEALERARELQRRSTDHVSLADATALIEHNTARLRVAELRRRKQRTS